MLLQWPGYSHPSFAGDYAASAARAEAAARPEPPHLWRGGRAGRRAPAWPGHPRLFATRREEPRNRETRRSQAEYDRDLVSLDQDDRRFKAVKEWQDSEVVLLDELYDVTAAVTGHRQDARDAHRSPIRLRRLRTRARRTSTPPASNSKAWSPTTPKPLRRLDPANSIVDGFHRVEAKHDAAEHDEQPPAVRSAMEHAIRRREARGRERQAADSALRRDVQAPRRRRDGRATAAWAAS